MTPMAENWVETAFPHRATGSYFDTASIGLVPEAVGRAVGRCYEALGGGVRRSAEWHRVLERTHEAFAAELGVKETEISFMASTGEAMNAIARAVPWQTGDEVLTLADDFPTVVLPWESLGDTVRAVQVTPLPGDDRLGALLRAIGPDTRLVCVSHINSFTGTRIDLRTLGHACARAGALLVCDGAQAAGCVEVDLDGVDFYIAAGYKWLLAGFGIAVVFGRESAVATLKPTLLGHGNVPPSTGLAYGHLNLAGVYALDAAAAVRREVGTAEIQARVAQLVRRIHDECAAMDLAPVADPAFSGGIVSLAGITDAAGTVQDLAALDVSVADRGGFLRISPHFYTSDTEVDQLLGALAKIRC